MEQFDSYVATANKAFKIADHLVYVTFPVVRDNKLMATALEQLFVALQSGMAALLYYDAAYKRISAFPTMFDKQLQIFKQFTCIRYQIGDGVCVLIRDVADFVRNRRESPVEFSRKDTYVIASQTYRLTTLTAEKMKRFILGAKEFLERVNEIHATSTRRTD